MHKRIYLLLFFFILFESLLFGQKNECKELTELMQSMEQELTNPKDELAKQLVQSRIYEVSSKLRRTNCDGELLIIEKTNDKVLPAIDSLRTRGDSPDLYSNYSSYLEAVASDECCKSLKYWDYEYYKYPYEEFSKMKFLKKRFNFKKINYPILQAAIIYKVNEYRRENNVPLLYFNRSLEAASVEHALDIEKTGVLSHTSGYPGRETPLRRAKAAGYTRSKVAENLSQDPAIEYDPESLVTIYTPDINGDYFSYKPKGKPIKPRTYMGMAERVLRSWKNNEALKKVVLTPDYLDVGVGIVHFKDNRFFGMDQFYVVQLFGGN
jgi:uncharacterized protein YkwD